MKQGDTLHSQTCTSILNYLGAAGLCLWMDSGLLAWFVLLTRNSCACITRELRGFFRSKLLSTGDGVVLPYPMWGDHFIESNIIFEDGDKEMWKRERKREQEREKDKEK